jgi:adenine deaminase
MLIHQHNVPVHVAYRLATYSAAKHFGLRRLGLVAPGKKADLVLLKNLENVKIQDVYIGGVRVGDLSLDKSVGSKLNTSQPPNENTIQRRPLVDADLSYDLVPGVYNVIEVVPDQIITNHLKVIFDGKKFDQQDVLFMANIERYGKGLAPGLGLVKGFGITDGAIASSVAHDSHNLMVVGTNTQDMILAANKLIECGGGFVVVHKKQVAALIPLPIAGLLSLKSADEIKEYIQKLKVAYKSIGGFLNEPFIQLAFLALPVIPTLKLTDKGLVDVTQFKFISLKQDIS